MKMILLSLITITLVACAKDNSSSTQNTNDEAENISNLGDVISSVAEFETTYGYQPGQIQFRLFRFDSITLNQYTCVGQNDGIVSLDFWNQISPYEKRALIYRLIAQCSLGINQADNRLMNISFYVGDSGHNYSGESIQYSLLNSSGLPTQQQLTDFWGIYLYSLSEALGYTIARPSILDNVSSIQ